MSQPKRYACLRQFGMLPAEDGIWVEYEDYAALAAENERLKAKPPLSDNPTWQAIGAYAEAKEEIGRLTAEKAALVQQGIRDHGDWRSKLNFLEADYKAEIARLRDENERLRKAGDAVVEDLEHLTKSGWFNKCKSVKAWHAAKEGGDAK